MNFVGHHQKEGQKIIGNHGGFGGNVGVWGMNYWGEDEKILTHKT